MTAPDMSGNPAGIGHRQQAQTQWDAFNIRLSSLLAAGDWESARDMLERAAESAEAPGSVHYNLGKVLMKLDRAMEAGPWFRRSAERDPDYPPTWFELGRWHGSRREFAEAAAAFRRAGRLLPYDTGSRRLAGRCAIAQGDWAAAAEAYGELLGLLPGDEEALIKGYKAACEARSPDAETLRAEILRHPELRGPLLNTTIRVSAGRLPLRPLAGQTGAVP